MSINSSSQCDLVVVAVLHNGGNRSGLRFLRLAKHGYGVTKGICSIGCSHCTVLSHGISVSCGKGQICFHAADGKLTCTGDREETILLVEGDYSLALIRSIGRHFRLFRSIHIQTDLLCLLLRVGKDNRRLANRECHGKSAVLIYCNCNLVSGNIKCTRCIVRCNNQCHIGQLQNIVLNCISTGCAQTVGCQYGISHLGFTSKVICIAGGIKGQCDAVACCADTSENRHFRFFCSIHIQTDLLCLLLRVGKDNRRLANRECHGKSAVLIYCNCNLVSGNIKCTRCIVRCNNQCHIGQLQNIVLNCISTGCAQTVGCQYGISHLGFTSKVICIAGGIKGQCDAVACCTNSGRCRFLRLFRVIINDNIAYANCSFGKCKHRLKHRSLQRDIVILAALYNGNIRCSLCFLSLTGQGNFITQCIGTVCCGSSTILGYSVGIRDSKCQIILCTINQQCSFTGNTECTFFFVERNNGLAGISDIAVFRVRGFTLKAVILLDLLDVICRQFHGTNMIILSIGINIKANLVATTIGVAGRIIGCAKTEVIAGYIARNLVTCTDSKIAFGINRVGIRNADTNCITCNIYGAGLLVLAVAVECNRITATGIAEGLCVAGDGGLGRSIVATGRLCFLRFFLNNRIAFRTGNTDFFGVFLT